MKKCFALLLIVLMLLLWGCGSEMDAPDVPKEPGTAINPGTSENHNQPGGETVEPTRPAEDVLGTLDTPALKVTVTINPELEFTLSRSNEILDAKALNSDAESLLAELELVGQSYSSGMTAILGEARDQGFLTDNVTVSISASELTEDAWNASSERILTEPVEDFRESAGIDLVCELNPVEDSTPVIARTHTNQRDGYQEVICYNAGNMHFLTKLIYDNGDYEEQYHLTGERFFWGSDGTYRYISGKDGVYTEYTDYPDGTRSTKTRTSDADGNPIWSIEERRDGTINEKFWEYENGVLFHYYSEESNGRVDSYYYDANGNTTYMLILDEFGTKIEVFYEDGEHIRDLYTNKDGSTEERFYEDGVHVLSIHTEVDGTVREETPPPEGGPQTIFPEGTVFNFTYYDNDNMKTSEIICPNGDYQYETYYENGDLATTMGQMDGRYYEEHYNENGICTYYYYKDSEGCEIKEIYDSNGNLQQFESRDADGTYLNDTYYENGECASAIFQQDGIYCEMRYDENGLTTYEFWREADGTETVYHFENGEETGYTVTYPDGTSETVTYD